MYVPPGSGATTHPRTVPLSPTPLRLRRRLGHGGLSLLVAATGTTLLWTASAGSAQAEPVAPGPVCTDGTCTVTFAATDGLQSFTVPGGVGSVRASVRGASGGGTWYASEPRQPGGAGGEATGTITTTPGEKLAVLVGRAGESRDLASQDGRPGQGGYGGGGEGGFAFGPSANGGSGGGGGSFVFGSDSTLLLAAGGGGATSGTHAGGAGSGPGLAAVAGADGDRGAGGGGGATSDANGTGGAAGEQSGGFAMAGDDGQGVTTAADALALGGRGGDADNWAPGPGQQDDQVGSGGGGGFHAGGGGGSTSFDNVDPMGLPSSGGGGGGGAGFAAAGVTDVTGAVGARVGDGEIVLTYAYAEQVTFTSNAPKEAVVGGTYTVEATGTGSADVVYSVDADTTNGACTLEGTTVSFLHVGTCVVAADQAGDAGHGAGRATQTIVVGQAIQSITFDPLDATATVGGTAELTATGGASGLPVVLTSSDTAVCTVSGTTLTFVAAGTCTVTATQAGNDDYAAAAPVQQEVAVDRVATTTSFVFDEQEPVFGQEVRATVTVTGASEGTVRLAVDGAEPGDAVPVDTDGKAELPVPAGLGAGGHDVTVTFTPDDATTYAGSSSSTTLAVGQAMTRTQLTVRSDEASVEVSAVAPGAGTPEGTVVFTVDGTPSAPVELRHGRAVLPGTVASGAEVAAEYSGDDDFTGSSDSTSRQDPTISADVSSEQSISPYGWYRTAVTVSFTCEAGSAPLSADGCPAAVTLSDEGASQSVTRTVTAEDGGIATASVTGINIDTTAPQVSTLFATDGDRFFAGSVPPAGCVGVDELSGVWGCAGILDRQGSKLRFDAYAVDRAGNQAQATANASTYDRGIIDAPYADGVYTVRAGQTYTLVAKSSHRAQVLKPTTGSTKPTKGWAKFRRTGKDTWALGYTIGRSLKVGTTYNLGIKTGAKHSIKIRVVA